MAAIKTFSRAVETLNVHPSSPVAVAVSGGCDSLALTILAKKVFNKITGITVDHKLCAESGDDAVRVGELVRGFGVDHHTVSLDWGPGGAPVGGRGSTLKEMRWKSYAALLETCKQLNIETLLVGHHHDDQRALLLARLSWESELDGLGLSPVSYWPGFPSTQIVRPLLEWTKGEVVEVCRREGVGEGKSEGTKRSTIDSNLKKIWSNVVSHCPSMSDGLAQLARSTSDATQLIQQKVSEAVMTLPSTNTELGCLHLESSQLEALPLFVRRRVLHVLANFVTSSRMNIKYDVLESLCEQLPLSKPVTVKDVVFIPMGSQLCVAKTNPTDREPLEIEVNKPLLWDRRWLISLSPLPGHKPNDKCRFKVRGVLNQHWQGAHKIRRKSIPHEKLRGGLPVITAKGGKVVVMPHFHVFDRSYGVSCEVQFRPSISLEELLNPLVATTQHSF